jgi:hypothetical protein
MKILPSSLFNQGITSFSSPEDNERNETPNDYNPEDLDCYYCTYFRQGAVIWVNGRVYVEPGQIESCNCYAAKEAMVLMLRSILSDDYGKWLAPIPHVTPFPTYMIRWFCKGQYYTPYAIPIKEEEPQGNCYDDVFPS